MAPDLLDMPEVVMNKIMEDIGIKAILTLRKVCHDLRNFIDDVMPDANLEYIAVSRESGDYISLHYQSSEGYNEIEYRDHIDGCLVKISSKENGKLLKNENFLCVCMMDVERVISHQKSLLKTFDVRPMSETERFDDWAFKKYFEWILKSRVPPLKVEFFNARLDDQNQIMSILPFLDSKALKRVIISRWGGNLEVDKLVKLDHWKNVQHMNLASCWIDLEYIQHFTHFSPTDKGFTTTHFPDLVSLKNIYLQSTGFKSIWIKITKPYNLDDVRRSTSLLGEQFFDGEVEENARNVKVKWYYRIPATDKVLEICVMKGEFPISLSRINEEKVPQGAVIQN